LQATEFEFGFDNKRIKRILKKWEGCKEGVKEML